MLSSLPLARAGKIKALGLTSLKRAIAAPEISTVEESGVKGFEFVSWYGLWGPRNLPADVSAFLQEASASAGAAGGEAAARRARLRPDRLDVGAVRQVHRHPRWRNMLRSSATPRSAHPSSRYNCRDR